MSYSEAELAELEKLEALSDAPKEWFDNYNFPELLTAYIKNNSIIEDDVTELGIDLNDHSLVLSSLIELSQSRLESIKRENYKDYESIANDEVLRKHALETLVTGYTKVETLLNDILNKSIAYERSLGEINQNISNHVEASKAELDTSINDFKTEVETINSMAINTVAKAMLEQAKENQIMIDNEYKKRNEFFDEQYAKLDKQFKETFKNANVKSMVNRSVITIALSMVFIQVIVFSILSYFK